MTPSRLVAAMRSRRGLSWSLAATLAISGWAALQPDADGEIVRSANAAQRPKGGAGRAVRADTPPRTPAPAWPDPPMARERDAWPLAEPAALAAWAPPAPPPAPSPSPAAPPAASPEPERPVAPPFPYTLIGRLDDGQPQALLANAARSFGARVADVIDGQWRIEDVQPTGITLTWLPDGSRQTLLFKPT